MGFLGWIKSRNAAQQQPAANKPQEQKPETAKQMYSRVARQDKTAQKPLDQMPPDQQAKVEAIKEKLEKATQHIDKNAQAPAPAPADATGSCGAMRQNMRGQDKTAPALSPTSERAGQPATGQTSSSRQPEKSSEKQAGHAQKTVPRPSPSWER